MQTVHFECSAKVKIIELIQLNFLLVDLLFRIEMRRLKLSRVQRS